MYEDYQNSNSQNNDQNVYQQNGFQQPDNNGYNNYNVYNGQPQNEKPNGKNTMGIVSMILGILSLVFTCCCLYLSIPLSVAAIITGIIALQKNEEKGFAIAGIITGALGLIFGIVTAILQIFMMRTGEYDKIINEIMEKYNINITE